MVLLKGPWFPEYWGETCYLHLHSMLFFSLMLTLDIHGGFIMEPLSPWAFSLTQESEVTLGLEVSPHIYQLHLWHATGQPTAIY